MENFRKKVIIDICMAIAYMVLAIMFILKRDWQFATYTMFFAGMTFYEARENTDLYFMAKKVFKQAQEMEETKCEISEE